MPRKGENIYHRKDGRWEGRFRADNRYRSVYGHSYLEIKNRLAKLRSVAPKTTHSGKLTVNECVNEWLATIKLRVKSSTYANYSMKVNKHILPAFGSMRYDQLTLTLLHCFIEEKLQSGHSEKYVSDIVIVLKSVSKFIAKTHSFSDILANVTMPKVQKKELELLTPEQQKRLCAYLKSNFDTTALCIYLSLYTGLRVGEVCGLMWGDIDFKKCTLTVRRTVQRISANGGTALNIGTPKSSSSCRTIPIPKKLMKLLRESRSKNDFYIYQAPRLLSSLGRFNEDSKVFLKKPVYRQ